MPYKHREPVSEREMMRDKYLGHHSICQTLREIYCITDDPMVKLKCRLAMAMAKAMHNKLKSYGERFKMEQKDEHGDSVPGQG